VTNKIGVVVSYGIYGAKAISIDNSPHHAVSIPLPEIFNGAPIGWIAYIDRTGMICFMEDPDGNL
jgi:hypothetical protein